METTSSIEEVRKNMKEAIETMRNDPRNLNKVIHMSKLCNRINVILKESDYESFDLREYPENDKFLESCYHMKDLDHYLGSDVDLNYIVGFPIMFMCYSYMFYQSKEENDSYDQYAIKLLNKLFYFLIFKDEYTSTMNHLDNHLSQDLNPNQDPSLTLAKN